MKSEFRAAWEFRRSTIERAVPQERERAYAAKHRRNTRSEFWASSAGQDPLKVQAATPAKLDRLIERASAAKLRKRPAPGKWSVGEILAHLADSEIVTAWRMRQILGAPGTPIQAFDQDVWAAAGHYEKRDARKSLELFRSVREANLRS